MNEIKSQEKITVQKQKKKKKKVMSKISKKVSPTNQKFSIKSREDGKEDVNESSHMKFNNIYTTSDKTCVIPYFFKDTNTNTSINSWYQWTKCR